ncbi:DUF4190 domain-containing protein [Actinomycetospora soli]|uniref:DUF4190 domain-containing protein n=1 Tax=Actinomycetospora soli TaxID=2893887 RepID=UPI001E41213D|nr:DUF4190 domain-containing protein [Actinomycetospora soli]MCD2191061.1 DUF4190 domain-containing protein [Actinomycetospora soli]
MRDARQNADDTDRQTPPNFLAILSLAFTIVCSPIAVLLGAIALRQIARTGQRGRELARLAVISGTALTVATLVIYLGIEMTTHGG